MKKYRTKNISSLKIPKVSEINLSDFDEYKSSIDFSNSKKVKQVLVEHFLAGDEETFLEILGLYLDHVGKDKVSKKTKIPQRTIYNFISGDHKTSSENIFKVMRFISEEDDAA